MGAKNGLKKLKKAIDNPQETRKLLRWMIEIVWPYKYTMLFTFLISLFSLLISYASTIVGKFVVDDATHGVINFRNMLIMVLTMVVSILFSMVSRIVGDYLNERFSFKIRVEIFNDIQRSVWIKIQKFHSGDIVTRLTSDMSTLTDGLISFIPSVILVGCQFLIAFVILCYYDWVMAVFAIIIGPIGAACNLIFRKKFYQYQRELKENEAEYRTYIQECLSNFAVMKTFMQEDHNEMVMERLRLKRQNIVMKSTKLAALMNALMRIVFRLGYVVAFCWGSYRISTGAITYGTLTVFISLVGNVQGSINGMASMVKTVYGIFVSGKRIYDISEIEKEVYHLGKEVPMKVGVSIDHMSFSYGGEMVLRDLSYEVDPGEKIGIIGESGIGKTTLIRNLMALVSPTEGSITFVDEKGNRELLSPDVRRFISYVPQGNTLISGTIEDNLRLGKEDATEEEMWTALDLAGARKFVKKLPEGIRTELTEKAGGISEGQAQRIAIARAMISEKPVLILDEATSALDENTEELVLENISKYFKEKTCFIITHRKSMLQYCDRVMEIREE